MKKKNKLELVLNAGLVVILLLLIVPFILGIYSSLAGLLSSDYMFKLTVGRSMTPAIMHGDTVLVKKGTEDIEVGDIISFKVDSIPMGITHRVVDIEENPTLIFQTKGDANNAPDGWNITEDQVEGKVVLVVPTSLFTRPYVLAPSILLPAILITTRVVYCFSKKGATTAATKNSKYQILNLTTILLMMILIISGGRLLSLILLANV